MSEHIEQLCREYSGVVEEIAATIEQMRQGGVKQAHINKIRELSKQAGVLEALRGEIIRSPVWTVFHKCASADYVLYNTPWFFHIPTYRHDGWPDLSAGAQGKPLSLTIPYGVHVEATYSSGHLLKLTVAQGKSRGRDLSDRMQFINIPKHVDSNFSGSVWGVLYLDEEDLSFVKTRYRARFEYTPTITNLLISDIITRDNPYIVDMAHVSFALIGDAIGDNKKIYSEDEATSLGFVSAGYMDHCPIWKTVHSLDMPTGRVIRYQSSNHNIKKVVFDEVEWECDTDGVVSPVIIASEWEKSISTRISVRAGNMGIIGDDYYRKGVIAEVRDLGGIYLIRSFYSVPHDGQYLGEIPTHCRHCGGRLLYVGTTIRYLVHQETNNECPGIVAARVKEFNRIMNIHIPEDAVMRFISTGGIADLGDYVCADEQFISSMLQAMNDTGDIGNVSREFGRRNAYIHTSLKSQSVDERLWSALVLGASIEGMSENIAGIIVEFLADQYIGILDDDGISAGPMEGVVEIITDYTKLLSIGLTQSQASRIFRSANMRKDELYRYFGHFLGL